MGSEGHELVIEFGEAVFERWMHNDDSRLPAARLAIHRYIETLERELAEARSLAITDEGIERAAHAAVLAVARQGRELGWESADDETTDEQIAAIAESSIADAILAERGARP